MEVSRPLGCSLAGAAQHFQFFCFLYVQVFKPSIVSKKECRLIQKTESYESKKYSRNNANIKLNRESTVVYSHGALTDTRAIPTSPEYRDPYGA